MRAILRKPWLWLAFILILAIAAAITMRATKAPPPAPKTVTLEFVASDLVYVKTQALAQLLPISGAMQPLHQAVVKAKVSGEIKQVLVREGESVKTGQLLVRFDTADLEARLAEKAANLATAKAQLSLAEKNHTTNQRLLQQSFISQNAFDAAQSNYQANVGTVQAWEAQTQLARNALRDARVVSPLLGVIAKRHVQTGEKVSFDAPLLTVVDLSQLEMQAMVPANEIPQLKIGMPVKLKVDGFADQYFEGKVERINPATESGTRSILVFIVLPNPKGKLKGGMFVTGEIGLDKTPPLPTLPQAAIRHENAQHYVWVIEQGKLARRNVVLGRRDVSADRVEIREGVTSDIPVLVGRFDNLKEGGLARIRTPENNSTAGAAQAASAQ